MMMKSPPDFVRSAAVLQVTDVKRSEAFYVDRLGFRSHGTWGDPPDFCIVQRVMSLSCSIGAGTKHRLRSISIGLPTSMSLKSTPCMRNSKLRVWKSRVARRTCHTDAGISTWVIPTVTSLPSVRTSSQCHMVQDWLRVADRDGYRDM
jgi:hypothetical protein